MNERNISKADRDIRFLTDFLNNKVMNEEQPIVPYNVFIQLYNLLFSDVGTKMQNNDLELFCNCLRKLNSAQVITMDPKEMRFVSDIKQEYRSSLSNLSTDSKKR